MVAAARHVARQGQRPALHPDHHLRDLPLPRRAVARPLRRRVCERPARRRHRGGGAAAGGVARALAEPARVGGVGGGAGPRLPEAPGRARRSGGEGAQGPHPHPPLQHPPAMARRRPRGPRRRRRRSLRLAGGRHGRGGVGGASGAERPLNVGGLRRCDGEASRKLTALNAGREVRQTRQDPGSGKAS